MDDVGGAARPKIYRVPQSRPEKTPRRRVWWWALLGGMMVVVLGSVVALREREAVSVAQTKPVPSAVAVPEVQSLSVLDEGGEVVGQLTRMPADIEQGASIDATVAVDPATGKELMNIIGRY